ncbi:MAG: RecX family transcriptional regulator [Anaerolineales bacterium]|jgi:regulatory protein|nr:RecX family transcriptional regulator [Anaerolineales bacterium]
MRKITAIESQKRNPNRVNLYFDDQFAFGLSRIVAAWLQVGQTLSEDKIAALLDEDAREVALQKALHFLSYRARSLDEVRKNLEKHEMPETVIQNTLERLQTAGLLNDQDFARTWVENRNTFRPRGRRALRLELRQKGLPEAVIESTLEEMTDEEALALQAARKHLRKMRGLDWLDFRKKMGGFLSRRGFPYEAIASVTRQVWQEEHPSGGDHFLEQEDE